MECKFYVGQKVVCVREYGAPRHSHKRVTPGKIYTVRSVVYCPFDKAVGIRIRGIINPLNWTGLEFAYRCDYFRPLHEAQINDLRKIARKAFDDAKKRLPEVAGK